MQNQNNERLSIKNLPQKLVAITTHTILNKERETSLIFRHCHFAECNQIILAILQNRKQY